MSTAYINIYSIPIISPMVKKWYRSMVEAPVAGAASKIISCEFGSRASVHVLFFHPSKAAQR